MLRGEPATSPSLHCIRGWEDSRQSDYALFTCAARSAALSSLTTLLALPDRPRACLLRPPLRQLPRSDGSSCALQWWRAVGSPPWFAHETIQASDLTTSTGISRALPSLLRCDGISIEAWCWRSGTLQTVVKRLFPFGGYLRPGNPGVDARSVGLSAVAPTPISPSPQTLQRPELARHHESRKKVSLVAGL